MLRPTQILIWRLTAIVALAAAITGVAVPVLPTVPFLILSAWAAGKGWPALERWLLAHRKYCPHISNWRARGAAPRNAKMSATLMMLASSAALAFSGSPLWLKIGAPTMMLAVAVWLWRRPDA